MKEGRSSYQRSSYSRGSVTRRVKDALAPLPTFTPVASSAEMTQPGTVTITLQND